MSVNRITPYLFFDGDAEQAIRLYERALDAKVEGLMRYSEMPGGEVPEADRQRVMHATLQIGAARLMLSDRQSSQTAPSGSNVHVTLELDTPAEVDRCFEALGVGARKVDQAPHDAFWGDRFAALEDAHGIQWMLVSPVAASGG